MTTASGTSLTERTFSRTIMLAGIAIARNEWDIAEAFVRHNAAVLAQLYIVDNRSSDATWEILQQLVASWLPIRLGRDDDSRFVEQITRQLGRANPPFRSREPGAEL
jgi:hypothetical protein